MYNGLLLIRSRDCLVVEKEREDDNAKRNILGLFVGLIIGLYTILGMSLFIFINLKFNSVYYAQHIPHKEGTEPDIIMLMENMVGPIHRNRRY
mgnify:CR=1 FL=1